jgi:hypothetical protein
LGLSRRARGPSRHVDRGDAAYAADTAALATAPNDPAANLDLATIALYHNDLDAAARHLARATATPTDDPRATTLDPDFAAEVGVTLSAAGSGVFAGGRQAALQRGTAATVQVGGVTMHDVNVMGLPTRQVPFFGERKPDGVIGTRFFTDFLTTLDYVNGALILRPRTDSAAFEREAGPSSVPMLWVGDHFLFVRGRINDGLEGWLSVDTGLVTLDEARSRRRLTRVLPHLRPDVRLRRDAAGHAVDFEALYAAQPPYWEISR